MTVNKITKAPTQNEIINSVNDLIDNKQDTISDLSTIRSNAANGQSAYTTIGGYGDIVTYNASNFATSAQGNLADTSIQPNDNISLLNNNAGFITGIDSTDVITALGYTPYNSTNPNGYTSNVGTVTSVNNIQPDVNGDVTISVTGGANTDLSNLTATGEAHFQAPISDLFVIRANADDGKTIYNDIHLYGEIVTSSSLLSVQMGNGATDTVDYQLLDGSTGLIPDARISSNIQRTSTAVTHTASTAVGNSTTPVYIASNGTATSTGLSIASSRFDGQWVQSFTTLMESSGTKKGVELSLSSYLPSDSYKYNVKFKFYCFDDDSTYYYHIETDIFNSGSTATGKDASTQIAGGTYSRQNVNIFDLPVGTGRYIKVYGSGADEINIYALGYCRIGTNS